MRINALLVGAETAEVEAANRHGLVACRELVLQGTVVVVASSLEEAAAHHHALRIMQVPVT